MFINRLMKNLYPLKFRPIYKERIWGGDKMPALLNKHYSMAHCGESWEISGVQDDISIVLNGFLKGNNLEELIEVYMDELVGEKIYDKFGTEFGIAGVNPGKAIMYQYVAIGLGDLSAGLLSNYLKSRKKTLFIFLSILAVFIVLYFSQSSGWGNTTSMYMICAGLGFGAGFSVLYITMSAEQFGTNLRASTAISIPNVVRGILPLIILLHKGLRSLTGNYVTGGWMTGIFIMLIAVIAAYHTKETFGRDLNFVEE